MSDTQHTPGPWYARHGQISSLTSTHGCTIADCNRTSRGISDEEAEANAALIVRAVNSHDDLLAALKECVTDDDACCFQDNAGSEMVEAMERRLNYVSEVARAAIQRAEGG